MYISTHTVAHHLRQAFRKLQIVSRVELARIVIEEAAAGDDLTAALPKPSKGTAPAGARAELATSTMWTALGTGILPATDSVP